MVHYAKFCPEGRACFECGDPNHLRNQYPKLKRTTTGNQAHGRAFMIGANKACQDPNVVTSMFLLNNFYASMLFDSGTDRSFISSEFASLIGVEISRLNDSYDLDRADGKLIKARDVALDCVLNLNNHDFKIDLIPLELGSFNLVISMDWLANNGAEIVCHEKSIRIPLENGELLIIKGERPGRELRIISCMNAWKCLRRQCHVSVAHVMEKKQKELKISDIPIIRDFSEVI
jgi:hypothetical protein